ncbi:MAG: hypothetical protein LBB14_02145 [Puniceicoccales bacterium]|nr:hypothetical protein [Puniceicoccales bacterium]
MQPRSFPASFPSGLPILSQEFCKLFASKGLECRENFSAADRDVVPTDSDGELQRKVLGLPLVDQYGLVCAFNRARGVPSYTCAPFGNAIEPGKLSIDYLREMQVFSFLFPRGFRIRTAAALDVVQRFTVFLRENMPDDFPQLGGKITQPALTTAIRSLLSIMQEYRLRNEPWLEDFIFEKFRLEYLETFQDIPPLVGMRERSRDMPAEIWHLSIGSCIVALLLMRHFYPNLRFGILEKNVQPNRYDLCFIFPKMEFPPYYTEISTDDWPDLPRRG